jgi:polysaccharide biosynthesis transport protein
VEYPDPKRAAAVANSIGARVADEIERLEGIEVVDGSSVESPVKLTVVEPANPAQEPVRPRPLMNLAIALMVGFMSSTTLAFVLEHLDTSIKNRDDFKEIIGELPILAEIPLSDDPRSERLFVKTRGHSVVAEAFRALRTNLGYINHDGGLNVILVTSPGPNEGKTTVNANLGAALAQSGYRVLLIAADLRRPRLHEAVSVKDKDLGLSNILIGVSSLRDAVTSTSVDGLFLLPPGPLPPNPAELLGSKRMADLLSEAREEFDFVIVDTPPVLAVTDAVILARMVDGVVMVAKANATHREACAKFVQTLEQTNTRLVGAVLNGVKLGSGYGYYYYSDVKEPGKERRFALSPGGLLLWGVLALAGGYALVSVLGVY